MTSIRSTLVALSLLALMPASSGAATKPLEPLVLGSENVIQVQWHTAQHRKRTVLSGYIDNESLYGMTRVRLLVEALDNQGAVIRQTVNWLGDDLGASTRTFFEVAAPGPAASYRVRVFAFDRYEGGKG